MKTSKKKSILRQIDIFGHPVSLLVQNENKYTTKCGGVITIIVYGLMVVYMVPLIIKLVL